MPEPIHPVIAAEIDKLLARRPDPRDWARKILKREAAGEVLPLISVQYAREALGIPLTPIPTAEPLELLPLLPSEEG